MFECIVSDPAVLGGKPIVKGTRISVEMILEWLASGATRDEIVNTYPHLTVQAVEEAIGYAAKAVKNEVLTTTEIHS